MPDRQPTEQVWAEGYEYARKENDARILVYRTALANLVNACNRVDVQALAVAVDEANKLLGTP